MTTINEEKSKVKREENNFRKLLNSLEKEEIEVLDKISNMLKKIGVPSNQKGCTYLRDAIFLYYQDPEKYQGKIEAVLYFDIAQYNVITFNKVRSNIRTVIDNTLIPKDTEYLNYFFRFSKNISKKELTASEFIIFVADELMLENQGTKEMRKVTDILLKIGIPRQNKGFSYLRDAIMIYYENIKKHQDRMNVVYSAIAIKRKETYNGVEYGIKYTIDMALRQGNIEYLNQLFKFPIDSVNRKISNAEFISLIADELMLEEKGSKEMNQITNLLSKMGMPRNMKGFHCLREAIFMHYDEDIPKQGVMMKVVYPKIAQKQGMTIVGVERAIRGAIQITFEKGNIEYLNKLYQSSQKRPSNMEFIILALKELRKS